jgi:ribosomal protein L13E
MGMKERLVLMAAMSAMMGGMDNYSHRNSIELKPFKKNPNEGLGISIEYLEQYALILNNKSKLGIVKQTRIKEKVEAYAERLIEYYELSSIHS